MDDGALQILEESLENFCECKEINYSRLEYYVLNHNWHVMDKRILRYDIGITLKEILPDG
jgi:hypothetical protein